MCVLHARPHKTAGSLEKERKREKKDGGKGQLGQGGVKRNTAIKQLIHAIHKCLRYLWGFRG